MALYGIADLHLSFHSPKPMDIFGNHWFQHHEKIRENWIRKVRTEDTVLIAGDISWAMKLEEALIDLQWIEELPGKKIIIKGNHDYWWAGISKLNQLYPSMDFLQNSYFGYEEYAICGTRGWTCPNENRFTEKDEKIYLREGQRLRNSLEQAAKSKYTKKLVMLHYPPTNDELQPSIFTGLCEEYGVEKVVYGHLHGAEAYGSGLLGDYNNVDYQLISCDYLNFDLRLIIE